MRVLAVVAHPDDELLGIGGTLLRHVGQGDEVRVHIECTQFLRNSVARMTDARFVSMDAGWTVTFGNSAELGYIVPELTINADIVYTHHPGDLNRDHRLIAEAVAVATRPYTADVGSVRYFETPSSTEWGSGFTPNLFVNVEAHLGEKLHLLARYRSELRPWPHPRSVEAIQDRARYWGSISGYPAAEPFTTRDRW